ALSTGAAAITLALAALRRDDDHTMPALETTETLALSAELGLLAAQAATSGRLAAPLLTGRYRTLFLPAIGLGIIVPLLAGLNGLARRRRTRRGRLLTSLLVLLGGLALRWSLVYAGKASADDPAAYWTMTR